MLERSIEKNEEESASEMRDEMDDVMAEPNSQLLRQAASSGGEGHCSDVGVSQNNAPIRHQVEDNFP